VKTFAPFLLIILLVIGAGYWLRESMRSAGEQAAEIAEEPRK
jgi:F0F1-type ATP synthase assembly protein I